MNAEDRQAEKTMEQPSSPPAALDTHEGERQPIDPSLVKQCLLRVKLFAACAAAFELSKPDSLPRVHQQVATYKISFRTVVGGRAAAQAAKVLLVSIDVAALESYVEQRRHPHTPGTGFPSIEVLQLLHMRFSVMHMDQGFRSSEIMT